MSDQKNYVVQWWYCDVHHCDFRGEESYKCMNLDDVLEQFKESKPWREFSSGLIPDAFGDKYFSYRIR